MYRFENLDWVSNGGACIDACLSSDVTRSFQIHDMKLKRFTIGC